MKLTIPDKNVFINTFLEPIRTVSDRVQLRLEGGYAHAIAISQDNSTIVCSSYKVEVDDPSRKILNIGSIQLIIRALTLLGDDKPVLKIEGNSLSYESKKQKWKTHLLEEGIIAALPYKKEKLLFDGTRIKLPKEAIRAILKATLITSHSSKVYLIHTGDSIVCEFTDKVHDNIDSYSEEIIKDYKGPSFNPIVIKVDSLQTSTKLAGDELTLKIDTDRGLIAFEDIGTGYETTIVFLPLSK